MDHFKIARAARNASGVSSAIEHGLAVTSVIDKSVQADTLVIVNHPINSNERPARP